jgi:hypothetical protein
MNILCISDSSQSTWLESFEPFFANFQENNTNYHIILYHYYYCSLMPYILKQIGWCVRALLYSSAKKQTWENYLNYYTKELPYLLFTANQYYYNIENIILLFEINFLDYFCDAEEDQYLTCNWLLN